MPFEKKKIEAETIILVQVTNPFFTVNDILKAYEIYNKNCGISVFAARQASYVWWAWQETKPIFPTFQGVRSQDLPPVFLPAGAFFICSMENLMETKSFFKPEARPFELENKNSVDIDTMEDLEMARFLWHRQRSTADLIKSE